ncbi:MnhB domain-containing protein [Methylobacterium sp. JK268]
MSPRLRLVVLGLAALALALPVARVIGALPPFGAETAEYGLRINAIAPAERHVANMVSAVNFDIRGLDTLGEEFMLLAAITGSVVLLRGRRGESIADKAIRLPGRPQAGRAEAVVLACRIAGPLTAVYGLYVVLHATVTPGGGFQGGVILASATLLTYCGEGYAGWRDSVRSAWLDALEGGGALLFALCGLVPMLFGLGFMENRLPLGSFRDLFSGGLMLVENLGVAAAVAGGFTQLFLEFMEETRAPKNPADDQPDAPAEEP